MSWQGTPRHHIHKMTKYKLHRTDGKTFFDFRSNPNSRCEGFTLTYCDDGTVVMSGDYGTLCWKRNYHHKGDKDFQRDYGFPNEETGIRYFEEKVCQFGIHQKVKEFNLGKAIEIFKDNYSDYEDKKEYKDALEEFERLEKYDEVKFRDIVQEIDIDFWETDWETYTSQFKFMFEALKSVAEQVLDAVDKKGRK